MRGSDSRDDRPAEAGAPSGQSAATSGAAAVSLGGTAVPPVGAAVPDGGTAVTPGQSAVQPPAVMFIHHLGIRIEEAIGGRSTLVLDLKPELLNTRGAMHGGVVMTMLDVSMAQAARSMVRHQGETDHGVMTIELKSTFMRGNTGKRVIARGHCVHRTPSLCFCEAEVVEEDGRVLARGSGTFKVLRPRPAAGRTTR